MGLNSFPAAQFVSDKNSPRKIVTRCDMEYTKHWNAVFGKYTETHVDIKNINIQKPKTDKIIWLKYTGNIQWWGSALNWP